ncbi:cell division protein FtsZ [Planobacterium oryzisoli]|uniref:Cell division protein FtsZ n=1 Tax=Planobacterium oryzisoli TaxID=2771435 RepID=A0A930YWC7_9FLAO|nr:cell division protein FtsZ [Planobacterium oryzisoli]MBF5027526.1 cell division protein FtsZ [Planobacterium oryzisoli]
MESFATQGFSFDLPKGNSSIIKVIGVGGGGNNALKHMYETGIHGVDFVVCNTDAQTLDNNPVANKVQLGASTTEGLGAGADPDVGEKAAIESMDEIKAALGQNTKMVFITAGMGGGTGTGAAPVIAKVAKEMGILTIGIVTVPFSFEGKRRLEQAEIGLDKLRSNVDSLIVINNDKLRQQFGDLGFKQGFAKADEVLTNAAKGMAEVITGYFDVNIDFRDAKSVLQNSGTALMSTGRAQGENKAEEAVKKALDSPLLNDNKITGAKNVLLLIRSGNEEVTMDEIGVIMDHIQKEAGHTADIIFGVGTDEELGDAVSVLVIATGFAKDNRKYDGPTEKIRFSLEDSSAQRRESPFKTKAEVLGKAEPSQQNVFRLDDEEDRGFSPLDGNSPAMSITANPMMVLEDPQTETPTQTESLELDLFSFEESEGDLQAESFTFETEEKQHTTAQDTGAQETPVEFAFKIAEQPLEDAQESMEAAAKDITKPQEQITTSADLSSQVEEKVEEQQFTFIEKPVDQDKVRERRNKLKEFNSRYQVVDEKNEFETIPAFRRKNISLGDQHHSTSTIGSFLTEDQEPRVRENQYLNKDVD